MNCFTSYTLVGSQEDVDRAFWALSALETTSRPHADDLSAEPHWLGYIASDILGLSTSEIDCRGTFCGLGNEYRDDKHSVIFATETPYRPAKKLIDKLAEKFNLTPNWFSEELSFGVFCKYSPDSIYTNTLRYTDEDSEKFFDTLSDFIKEYGEMYKVHEGQSLDEVQDIIADTEKGELIIIDDLLDPKAQDKYEYYFV